MKSFLTICFCLSALALSVGGIRYCYRRKYFKEKFSSWRNFLYVALAAIILLLPLNYNFMVGRDILCFDEHFLYVIGTSLHDAIQFFTFGSSTNDIMQFFDGEHGIAICSGWRTAYLIYLFVLRILAPALTATAILGMISNILSGIWSIGKPCVFVFNTVSEKSVILAEDIINKNIKFGSSKRKPAIIFADANGKDSNEDLMSRAMQLHAEFCNYNADNNAFARLNRKKQVWYFFCSDDESRNVAEALSVINYVNENTAKLKKREETRLYVFSTTAEGELLLSDARADAIKKAEKTEGKDGVGNIRLKIQRVDEVKSFVYNLLYNEGHRIFANAFKTVDTEEGKKRVINAHVYGLGKHGTEEVKALAWYCQMDGYMLNINVYESDSLKISGFKAAYPELVTHENKKGDANYKIDFCQMNVETEEFVEHFKGCDDMTFIFVALGTDSDNIRVSAYMRMLCERYGFNPLIYSIVRNPSKEKALQQVVNHKNQSYDIAFKGSATEIYSFRNVTNAELDEMAFTPSAYDIASHKTMSLEQLKYRRQKELWGSEYNYLSTLAGKIHEKARSECGMPLSDKDFASEFLETDTYLYQLNRIRVIEHSRWNAYVRGCGYIYQGGKRNDMAKIHNDLIQYDDLPGKEQLKDIRLDSSFAEDFGKVDIVRAELEMKRHSKK